jgi:transposase
VRKRAEGKTGREAMHCLKRRLSDLIYNTMHEELAARLELQEVSGQGR